MTKIASLQLIRARFGELPRVPWRLALLFVLDIVELSLSFAVLAASAPRGAALRPSYATLDVPYAAPAVGQGAAFAGITLGLVMLASLLAEVWMMVRVAQLRTWRRRRTGAGNANGSATRAQAELRTRGATDLASTGGTAAQTRSSSRG